MEITPLRKVSQSFLPIPTPPNNADIIEGMKQKDHKSTKSTFANS